MSSLVVVAASDNLHRTPGAERWGYHTLDGLLKTMPVRATVLSRGVTGVESWANERAEACGHYRQEYRPSGVRWCCRQGATPWARCHPGHWQASAMVVATALLKRNLRGWVVDVWALCLPGDDCTDPVITLARGHGLTVEPFYLPLATEVAPRFLRPKMHEAL